jgi:hypothetical protein
VLGQDARAHRGSEFRGLGGYDIDAAAISGVQAREEEIAVES